MIICGIKLTHDGAIALLDNDRLIFSHETEKNNNNNRHADFNLTYNEIESILNQYGYNFSDIDSVVIDGWREDYQPNDFVVGDKSFKVTLNKYDPFTSKNDVLHYVESDFSALNKNCFSYHHISSHVSSAYCTSPFAKKNESGFIMVWDGAIGCQLYYFDVTIKKFENCGYVHYLFGSTYAELAVKYPPFNAFKVNDMSIPGKLMAYIANGKPRSEIVQIFKKGYYEELSLFNAITSNDDIRNFSQSFTKKASNNLKTISFSSDDILASYHEFIAELIIDQLKIKIPGFVNYAANVCFAGGSALNIKWNSTIRNSGIFSEMWVPPFPNDSGSAIGAACCELIRSTDKLSLNWNVFSGQEIIKSDNIPSGWINKPYTIKELASVIYESGEPVVVLIGRAELGPRALGHRSIISPAVSKEMKQKLNIMKDREGYRPVAPICLEQYAKEVFDPGIPDPLMLYDHFVKEEWKDKVPAICHLDGSARLQTVNELDNPEIYELLHAYFNLSGIPLLCNTSANFNGKGFFPDLPSAMLWNKSRFIWFKNELWTNLNYRE